MIRHVLVSGTCLVVLFGLGFMAVRLLQEALSAKPHDPCRCHPLLDVDGRRQR